jgi:hypothetical protein
MSVGLKPRMKDLVLAIPTYVGWAVWVVVALICLAILIFWRVGYGESSLIGRLIDHWPLTALLALVGLMIAGYFGGGLGLPTLFRDDPDDGHRFFGRAFGAGFGSSLVVVVVWVVIFFCDFITVQERIAFHKAQTEEIAPDGMGSDGLSKNDRAPRVVVRGQFQVLGGLLQELRTMVETATGFEGEGAVKDQLGSLRREVAGFQDYLAELADRPLPSGFTLANRDDSISFVIRLARIDGKILSIESLQARSTIDRPGPARRQRLREIERKGWFILFLVHLEEFKSYFLIGSVTTILLLLGCVGVTTPELAKRRLSSRSPLLAYRELCGYLLGCISLVILAAIMLGFLFETYRLVRGVLAASGPASYWLSTALKTTTRFQNLASAFSVLIFIAGLLAVFSVVLNRTRVGAGLGICMLFSVAALLYLFLAVIEPESQLLVVGGLAVGLIWINSSPFKYRFPGMDSYYNDPINLHQEDDAIEREGAKHHPGPLDEGQPLLLDDREVLEAWAGRLRAANGGRKPKLVLVTATGAAYRASFWTTVVLERLERDLPGFINHVRLITGASGGMVGAAYVVAMLEEPIAGIGVSPSLKATERLKADSGGDSLSPVVRKLIDGDLPRAFLPWTQSQDRGRTLEDQWKALDGVTFDRLRQGEKEGWRPSLILSPMIVETGRRLLFSNLDLYGLTDIQARNRKSVSIEEEDSGPLPPEGGNRRLSRSAVEFFRAFPKVYRDFQVKVAVRMNASFPFISPAVSLPVQPPRRMADAGYYDNYGVNLAASWAFANRRWIREQTSGLALIQIRAYESEALRKRLWVEPREEDTGKPPRGLGRWKAWLGARLGCGLNALSTPFQSLASARQWSMSYRNDEQVSLLGEVFNDRYDLESDDWTCVDRVRRKGQNGWFETFVFENPLKFGMNWLMTGGEIEEMRKCFDPGDGLPANARLSRKNLGQLDRLMDWWSDRKDRGAGGQVAPQTSANGNGPISQSSPLAETLLADGPVKS